MFPCISTGIYGFPKRPAAKIAIATCIQEQQKECCPKIIFCCFAEEEYEIYQEILA